MAENEQPKTRPKIKSSFGAVLQTKQQMTEPPQPQPEQEAGSSPVAQSPSLPVAQKKAAKAKRTKKGVYLMPGTAKWLDIQAATEGREISELTQEALELLQKVREGKAKVIEE